jgi:aldehyde dehydrogenase (NAD+)
MSAAEQIATDRFVKVADIPEIVAELRTSYEAGRSRPLAWRLAQLDGLRRLIRENEQAIIEAVASDLGKPTVEAYSAEVAFTLNELELVHKNLPSWMKPERVRAPLVTQPSQGRIHKDSLGVVLIIAPWNYPFQLSIAPLIGAIAGGNCAIVKPSEVSDATSALIARLLPHYVDSNCIRVMEGAVTETTALLAERFDHIFYTGNGAVARIVMTAAAKHLTPVTLELGGKSPCIIDRDVDLEVACRRITWGKYYNAGQTCVAPDYILAHRDIYDEFLERMRATIRRFFGPNPQQSPDLARIINKRHHQRLSGLLDSGDIVIGGEADESECYLAPTILKNVAPDSPVMSQEIFGPILPVLCIDQVDDAIRFINARPKPLALYLFSNDRHVQDQVIERTSSGGATINHVWVHLAVPELPFGGVGESGMGAYHGRSTFDTFTHRKSVLSKPTFLDPAIMYPPYTAIKAKWIRRLL